MNEWDKSWSELKNKKRDATRQTWRSRKRDGKHERRRGKGGEREKVGSEIRSKYTFFFFPYPADGL